MKNINVYRCQAKGRNDDGFECNGKCDNCVDYKTVTLKLTDEELEYRQSFGGM